MKIWNKLAAIVCLVLTIVFAVFGISIHSWQYQQETTYGLDQDGRHSTAFSFSLPGAFTVNTQISSEAMLIALRYYPYIYVLNMDGTTRCTVDVGIEIGELACATMVGGWIYAVGCAPGPTEWSARGIFKSTLNRIARMYRLDRLMMRKLAEKVVGSDFADFLSSFGGAATTLSPGFGCVVDGRTIVPNNPTTNNIQANIHASLIFQLMSQAGVTIREMVGLIHHNTRGNKWDGVLVLNDATIKVLMGYVNHVIDKLFTSCPTIGVLKENLRASLTNDFKTKLEHIAHNTWIQLDSEFPGYFDKTDPDSLIWTDALDHYPEGLPDVVDLATPNSPHDACIIEGRFFFIGRENTQIQKLIIDLYNDMMARFFEGLPYISDLVSASIRDTWITDNSKPGSKSRSWVGPVAKTTTALIELRYGTYLHARVAEELYFSGDYTLDAYLDRASLLSASRSLLGQVAIQLGPRSQETHLATLLAMNYMGLVYGSSFVSGQWRYFEAYYKNNPAYKIVGRIPKDITAVTRHGVQIFWMATFNADGTCATSLGPTVTMDYLRQNINNLDAIIAQYDSVHLPRVFVGIDNSGATVVRQLFDVLFRFRTGDPTLILWPPGLNPVPPLNQSP
ncbi:MAG: hypothetical protein Q6370_018620 [Candidatus Sigynarchaeota archaeon]